MPRGFSVYENALIQGRLWTPDLLSATELRFLVSSKVRASMSISTGVDTWRDLSRNGRDVNTISTRPTLVENVLNGFPCVRFNNSPMNSTATIETGSTFSVICLLKDNLTAATIQEPFSIGTANNTAAMEFVLDFITTLGTNRFCFFGGVLRANMFANYSDSPALLAMGLNGGVSNIRANGVNGTSTGTGISTGTAVFRVGGSRPQNQYPLNGDLYSIMVLAAPIGSPEYLRAEAWMAGDFGVPDRLGAAHPFANRPPLIGD